MWLLCEGYYSEKLVVKSVARQWLSDLKKEELVKISFFFFVHFKIDVENDEIQSLAKSKEGGIGVCKVSLSTVLL